MTTRTINKQTYNLQVVKRGRKLTPTQKKQMAVAEYKINKLQVGETAFLIDYGRTFRIRLRTMVCRIEDKKFTVHTPDNSKKVLVIRLS